MGVATGSRQSDSPTPALSRCTWNGPAGQGTRYVTVLIRGLQAATGVLNSNFKTVQGVQAVSGIGSEAYAKPGENQQPSNYRFLTMAAVAGDLYIQLDIAGPARADTPALDALKTAMQAAVARLPRR
jgi:hypothetical protein